MHTQTIKRIASALLVTSALTLVAACSSGNDNSPPLTTPTNPTQPTNPTNPTTPTDPTTPTNPTNPPGTPPLATPATFGDLTTGQSLNTQTQVVTFTDPLRQSGELSTASSGTLQGGGNTHTLTVPSAYGSSAYTISQSGGFNASDTASNSSITGNYASNTGLTYSSYGVWATTDNDISGALRSAGVFATGVPIGTGTAAMPTSGSASYSGKTSGFISMNSGERFKLAGDVSLSANFGANSISGSMTGMTATPLANGTLNASASAINTNNINLSGGVITGANFAGQAVSAEHHSGVGFHIGGSAGLFSGSFYGPGAAEAAGTMQMTQPGMNIVSSFGAKK